MKNLLLIILISCIASFSFGQCEEFGFDLNISGFICGNQEGAICFETNADWVFPVNECVDYVIEIEYPTGSFIYTDLNPNGFGGFYLHSQNSAVTILRHVPQIIFDVTSSSCFLGVVQIPGTVFTLRIVHPDDPTDIVNTTTFTVDDFKTVGSSGTKTNLTQAISAGDLLDVVTAGNTAQRVLIEGTLLVDESYVFGAPMGGGSNEILMGANAKIIVLKDNFMGTIRASISACNENWNRLIVQPGAEYSAFRTKISDASVAVELKNNATFSIRQSSITNCDTGIGSFGGKTKNITVNIVSNPFVQSSIRNCNTGARFENVELLDLVGYLNFLDIETDGISLENTDLTGRYLNFNGCLGGINSTSSESLLDISECSFNDGFFGIQEYGNSNMSVIESNFSELGYGIIKGTAVSGETTLIENNFSIDCNTDVYGSVLPSFGNIIFNEYTSQAHNVWLNGIGSGAHKWAIQHNEKLSANGFGSNVYFSGINNGRIFNNEVIFNSGKNIRINGGENNLTGYNIMGTENDDNIVITGSTQNQVYCNDVIGKTGIVIQNDCAGGDIRGNKMSGSSFNLSYGSPFNAFANTGIQEYKGNSFDASTELNPKAINFGNPLLAERNQYLVGLLAGNQGTSLFPYFNASFNKWFDKLEEGVDYTCSPGTPPPGPPSNVDIIKNTVKSIIPLLDEDIISQYGSEIEFDTKLKLYRALSELQSLQPLDETEQYWYDLLVDDPVGEFISFESILTSLLEPNEDSQLQIENLVAEINTTLGQIRTIERYDIDENTDEITLNQGNANLIGSKYEELAVLKDQLTTILANQKAELLNYLMSTAEINSNISELNTISAQNLQTVNTLLIKRLSDEVFSTAEVQSLENIANQCVGYGGEGVYVARSLLSELTLNTEFYDDECIQESEYRIGINPSLKDESIGIFPNPADSEITLRFPNEFSGSEIHILNSIGQFVEKISINSETTKISINTAKYPNGIYFVKSEIENTLFSKFSIQH